MALLSNLFVQHHDINDVTLFLRDARVPEVFLVPPPVDQDPWVGIYPASTDGHPETLAQQLSVPFRRVLELQWVQASLVLRIFSDGREVLHLNVACDSTESDRAGAAQKQEAKQMASLLTAALANPKVQTKLVRIFSRRTDPGEVAERLGEALHLPCCRSSYEDLASQGGWDRFIWVNEGRVRGKSASATAGAGYAHVSELIEDTVADLLQKGRAAAALRQLRNFDIHLTAKDDALGCVAPPGMVTPGLRDALRDHKALLLAELQPAS